MAKIKGIKLSYLIEKKNESQPELPRITKSFIADRIGVSNAMLTQWDSGKTVPLSIQTLYDISKILGCTMEELLEIE